MRHGAYDLDSGGLDPMGVRHVENVAGQMVPFIHGGSVVILHSLAKRAEQSAGIVSKVLGGVVCVPRMELGKEQNQLVHVEAAMNLVSVGYSDKDVVIAITHAEHIQELFFPIGRMLGKMIDLEIINAGCAVLFDLVAKEFVLLAPK